MSHITRKEIDQMLRFSVGKSYKSMEKLEQFDLSYSTITEEEERHEILEQLICNDLLSSTIFQRSPQTY